MKDSTIKYIALRAESSALKIDVCLAAMLRAIEIVKSDSEKNGDEGAYVAKSLDAIHTLLNEEIDELFQIKHDLCKGIKPIQKEKKMEVSKSFS